jgi:hypothetical protein
MSEYDWQITYGPPRDELTWWQITMPGTDVVVGYEAVLPAFSCVAGTYNLPQHPAAGKAGGA